MKTSKLYFLDTGLAAYLTKWNSPDVLKNGAMAGAFFESFVISEIIKSYCNKGITDPPLYFYRDNDMNEIDLLIEQNGTLYPLEMKKHSDPQRATLLLFLSWKIFLVSSGVRVELSVFTMTLFRLKAGTG